MRISHSASRSLAAGVLLALALGACGKDNGPSEFNPDAMSSDLGQAQAAFDSPATASFGASGSAMASVLGGAAPAVVSPSVALLHPTSAQAYAYAKSVAKMLPKVSRISAASAAIPEQYLGVTFVWDVETQAYVASELAGAPEQGVRFLLYAVNPVTGEPAEPLNELGFADVIDVSAGSTVGTRIVVHADGVTYLDYTISGTGTETSGALSIEGFAFNGTQRVNFSLADTIAQSPNGIVLTLDFSLTVPGRDLTITYTATFANLTPDQIAVTLDFHVSGANGDVRISGTYAAEGGSFSVRVNGELFATVTLTNGEPVITTAHGTELTAQEEASLQAILAFYDGSLSVFDGLLMPVT